MGYTNAELKEIREILNKINKYRIEAQDAYSKGFHDKQIFNNGALYYGARRANGLWSASKKLENKLNEKYKIRITSSGMSPTKYRIDRQKKPFIKGISPKFQERR